MEGPINHKTILFFGELPPASVHGISLSNQLNIDLLRDKFNVLIIQENSSLRKHGRLTWLKLFNLLKYIFLVARYSIQNSFSYYYLNFSMSSIGVIKTLLLVTTFRIFNRSQIVLHMHRGDFFCFYQHRINRIIASIIFNLSSKIVVLSSSQQTKLRQIFKKPVEVLENALPQEYFFGNKTFNNTFFLYISNYILEKGVLDLIEVFNAISSEDQRLRLECYGMFSDESLKEKIYRYQSSNITINKGIFGKEKFKKIYESYCLILPSWSEGQPLILLEAMSQGTPVIATDVGLVREMLGQTYPYIFQPGNKEELAQMISLYLADQNKGNISNYLRSRYDECFCREDHRKKLLKIFAEI